VLHYTSFAYFVPFQGRTGISIFGKIVVQIILGPKKNKNKCKKIKKEKAKSAISNKHYFVYWKSA
jgi:hypothetical protein